jgi:hypothetical protein
MPACCRCAGSPLRTKRLPASGSGQPPPAPAPTPDWRYIDWDAVVKTNANKEGVVAPPRVIKALRISYVVMWLTSLLKLAMHHDLRFLPWLFIIVFMYWLTTKM